MSGRGNKIEVIGGCQRIQDNCAVGTPWPSILSCSSTVQMYHYPVNSMVVCLNYAHC